MDQTTNTPSGLNSVLTGVIAGILIPMLAILIFFSTKYPNESFKDLVTLSLKIRVLPQLISICVVPNLGLFFLFMWRNHLYSARGVILATFIITVGVLLIKGAM